MKVDRETVRGRMAANLEADGIRVVPTEIEEILDSATERVNHLLELAEQYDCSIAAPESVRRQEPVHE